MERKKYDIKECRYKNRVNKKAGSSNLPNHEANVIEIENKDFVAMITELHMAFVVKSRNW